MQTFQLARSDLAGLDQALLKNLQGSKLEQSVRFLVNVFGGFLFGLGVYSLRLAYNCCEESQGLLIKGLALLAASLFVFGALNYSDKMRRNSMAISRNGWFLAPQTMELTEIGIVHTTKIGRSEMPWTAFIGRREDERNHYIFIEPSMAFILPKAAIDLAEQEMLQSHIKLDA